VGEERGPSEGGRSPPFPAEFSSAVETPFVAVSADRERDDRRGDKGRVPLVEQPSGAPIGVPGRPGRSIFRDSRPRFPRTRRDAASLGTPHARGQIATCAAAGHGRAAALRPPWRTTLLLAGGGQRPLPGDNTRPGWFLLRVQEPTRRSADELRSELLWLSALRREGGLAAPEPLSTRDGAAFAAVSIPGVSQPRRCVLLRWVEGHRRAANLTPVHAHRMGAYTARLHRFSRGWSAPAGFARPRWDPERWIGASSPLWSRATQVYTSDELRTFAAAARRIRGDLRALGEGPNTFGVIHADLAPVNFVFRSGEAYAIDFEECGWGYYLFDVAVALTALEDYGEHSGRLQDAFLDGYRRESPLPELDPEFREAFMAIVLIKIVEWTLGWEDPALRPRGDEYLAHAVKRLRHFADRGGTMSRGL